MATTDVKSPSQVEQGPTQTTTPANPTLAPMAENQARTTPANPTNTPLQSRLKISQRHPDIYHTPLSVDTPYLELVDKETKFRHMVNMLCYAIATIKFLHIAFGIIITTLGASSSPHKITTIFGVLNTATAVVLVVLRQQRLVPKPNNFREAWIKMRSIYEEIERNTRSRDTDSRKLRVYKQAMDKESYFRLRYWAFNYLGYLQVVIGLTVTALAASSSPPIVITVFGALNAVATGVPSLTRGQVLPNRLRLEWEEFNMLIDAAELREGDEDFARMHAKMRAAILEYV